MIEDKKVLELLRSRRKQSIEFKNKKEEEIKQKKEEEYNNYVKTITFNSKALDIRIFYQLIDLYSEYEKGEIELDYLTINLVTPTDLIDRKELELQKEYYDRQKTQKVESNNVIINFEKNNNSFNEVVPALFNCDKYEALGFQYNGILRISIKDFKELLHKALTDQLRLNDFGYEIKNLLKQSAKELQERRIKRIVFYQEFMDNKNTLYYEICKEIIALYDKNPYSEEYHVTIPIIEENETSKIWARMGLNAKDKLESFKSTVSKKELVIYIPYYENGKKKVYLPVIKDDFEKAFDKCELEYCRNTNKNYFDTELSVTINGDVLRQLIYNSGEDTKEYKK